MCFSASVSFISSLVLLLVGIQALRLSKSKCFKPLATIPLLFAAQQAAEGIVWISPLDSLAYQLGTYAFLIFAFVIWPIWIPATLYQIEQEPIRKKVIYFFGILGTLWALILLTLIVIYPPEAIISCHIAYQFTSLPFFISDRVALFLYYIPTITPFFITSKKVFPIFGIILSLFLLITLYFWQNYLTSIWCFFAAALSIFILMIVRKKVVIKSYSLE